MVQAEVGKRYHHYKGGEYTVLHVAHHTETDEKMVVYQAEYDTEDLGPRPVFVRPKEMFEERIIIDGEELERFSEI